MLPVKLNEIVDAIDSGGEEHSNYLDKRTGEVILISNEEMEAAEDDEPLSNYPDWQRESLLKARELLRSSDDFLPLPDQFEVHEYQIMEDFCREHKDRQAGEQWLGLINGSGAFRRFKNAISSLGAQNDWYKFKRAKLEEMAIEWLEEHEVPYTRDDQVAAPDSD